ncbi:hypothetical protein KAI19_02225 [bacterium]|nr:hypothetical protein [bacterium]
MHKIAKKYLPLSDFYTSSSLVKEIKKINDINQTGLKINKKLRIPVVRTKPVKAKTVTKDKSFNARGIYITGNTAGAERILTLAKKLKSVGGNTIVFDVKDIDGVVTYKSSVRLAKEIGATEKSQIRDISKMIYLLHEERIHVVARIALFCDEILAKKRPELAIQSKSKGGVWKQKGKLRWVDPSLEQVQKYNLDLVTELCDLGVDEVQFDYIRFPAMGKVKDAKYSFDETKTEKHAIITSFLKKAYELTRRKKVLLSIDVYAITAWQRKEDEEITGQRIRDLAKYADVISPMLYPSHFYGRFEGRKNPADHPYYFVSQGCKKTRIATEKTGIIIRPWLQAFPYKITKSKWNKDYILEQIKAAKETGACGWLLWSANNNYKVSWQALKSH